MNDIPFGDHFTVESRWDYSVQQPAPDGAPRTLVSSLNFGMGFSGSSLAVA